MNDRPAEPVSGEECQTSYSGFVQEVTESKLWPAARKHTAFRRLPPDRAKDILQETLLRTSARWAAELIWRSHDYRLASVLKTMSYVACEESRRYRAYGHYEDPSVAHGQPGSDDVESRVIGRLALAAVQEGLAQLTDEERLLIELGAEEIPAAVIGELLKVTPTNARTKLKRARDKLRKVIETKELRNLGPGEDEADAGNAGDVA